MILHIVLTILTAGIIYTFSIFAHEIGHALAYMKRTGRKPTFHFNKVGRFGFEIEMKDQGKPLELDNEDYKEVYKTGILAGLIMSVLLSVLFFNSFILSIPVSAFYLYGCRSDIQELIHCYKTDKNNGV